MQRSVHIASRLGGASILMVILASALAGQAPADPNADALARMRADLSAKRYAAVISAANRALESARTITTPLRVELWQLLAAAYYPDASAAQKPDSARLPLEALIRIAPDFKIARELSWSGLDELTDRVRAESFAVASRPLTEYILSAGATGHVAVVASRPTRFLLTSTDEASGRTVVHDSAAFVTSALLELRTHSADGPVFPTGSHQLFILAYDASSGDSLRIAHRVRAVRRDLPRSTEEAAGGAVGIARSAPPDTPPDTPPSRVIAEQPRRAMLWGGLALAAATAVIAQEARPDDGLRSAFRVDARAFVVGAAMAGAAVLNFRTDRAPVQRERRPPSDARISPAPTNDRYRVRLQLVTPEH